MRRYIRWTAGLVIAGLLAGAGLQTPTIARAEAPALARVSVDQLKGDALAALKKGEFDRSSELLKQAAATNPDPKLQMMASWVSAFSTQYTQTLAGRKAEHDKAVGQAKLLLSKNLPDYALEAVARANALAADKRAFRAEAWVDDLLKARYAAAEQFEQNGEHNEAVRIYVALSAIDQADPALKAKLKAAARFVRVQALYAPQYYRQLNKDRQKEDDRVDAILRDAGLTRTVMQRHGGKSESATTQPADKKSENATDIDSAMIDWRDTVKGIEYDVINEAARDAIANYYREVNYRQLATGGLQALRIMAMTPKIDGQFPGLADGGRRTQFVAAVDAAQAKIGAAKEADYSTFKDVVSDIQDANKQSVNLPESVLAYEFLDGAFAELDQFTSMIWPQQIEEFQTMTEGEFSGVGIQIERGDTGDLRVVSPIEDTPAYRAGIKSGDLITHINGELAKGMMLDQAVKRIKGKSGTSVTLTVRSPDATSKDYVLKRDTIKVASIKGWKRQPGGSWDYMVDPVQRVGYVRLTSFSKTSARDLERAIKEMQDNGARGLILDLRSDPGGLLNVAIDVSNMFIPSGTLVSTRADRETGNSPQVAEADSDARKYDMPMVVLVNQFSASASEIVSGALKDHKRAIVVGERTYGKGSVQMTFRVAKGAAELKLTIARYYLPSGRCLHREENSTVWGVDPDFPIEMSPEQVRQVVELRSDMDVLHTPGEGEAKPTTRPADLIDVDPQLSAAVLLMRLQIAGAKIQG